MSSSWHISCGFYLGMSNPGLSPTHSVLRGRLICIITNANTTGRKAKPIGKNTPTLIFDIVCQEPVKSVPLFTSTTFVTKTLRKFFNAFFSVNILIEWEDIDYVKKKKQTER